MALSATVSAPCATGGLRSVQRRAPAARSLRVCCQQQVAKAPEQKVVDLKILAAGFAAAALVFSSAPAEAGVILTQPETKKVFQGASSTPTTSAAAPAAAKTASSSSAPGFEFGLTSFNPRGLIFPVAVVSITGGAFALNTIDPGFMGTVSGSFNNKDSNKIGPGYEPTLKDGSYANKGKGTRKIGGKSPFGSFGKKK